MPARSMLRMAPAQVLEGQVVEVQVVEGQVLEVLVLEVQVFDAGLGARAVPSPAAVDGGDSAPRPKKRAICPVSYTRLWGKDRPR